MKTAKDNVEQIGEKPQKSKPKLTGADLMGVVGGWLIATAVAGLARACGLMLGFVPSVLLFLGGFWLTKTTVNKVTKKETNVKKGAKPNDRDKRNKIG